MKRKFKLITSVASLCLAIALMAFGVYAAANPTVTVTGSVTFSATHVYADVYADVADAAVAKDGALTFDYQGVDATQFRNEATSTKDYGTLTMPAINDMNVKSAYQVRIVDKASSAKVGVKLDSVTLTADLTGKEGAHVELYISNSASELGTAVTYTSGTEIKDNTTIANDTTEIYITVVVWVVPVVAENSITVAPALNITLGRYTVA